MSLLKEIGKLFQQAEKAHADVRALYAAAEKLQIGDRNNAYAAMGQSPSISLYLTADKLRAECIRLLPVVGKFSKKFDENCGLLEVTASIEGVDLRLVSRLPSTCAVRQVKEEVEVPAVEAHTETHIRYVLVGDCEPLTALDVEID